jgi:hypothetical protein
MLASLADRPLPLSSPQQLEEACTAKVSFLLCMLWQPAGSLVSAAQVLEHAGDAAVAAIGRRLPFLRRLELLRGMQATESALVELSGERWAAGAQ